jgi:hypothetical protein
MAAKTLEVGAVSQYHQPSFEEIRIRIAPILEPSKSSGNFPNSLNFEVQVIDNRTTVLI